MTKHSDLIARIEAAEGPSRELDCLIWCATAESHFEYHGGDCVLAVQGGFCARLDWKDIPHPTSSLDAAMTLVPEGCLQGSLRWSGDAVCAEVWGNLRDGVFTGDATTPALALCAAALRAQEASE